MRQRVARMDPEGLMRVIGKDMMALLKEQGRAAVREVVIAANRQGVEADDLPYAFWALASSGTELPSFGLRQKIYSLMIDIMARTGVMPNYQRAFKPVDSQSVDEAVDAVALHMSMWAAKVLAPALIIGYYTVLDRWAPKVPEATGGKVHALLGRDYLDHLFREILTLRSAMFDDGELIRRVVRFIPE
jgi:hypothetical protein